MSADKARPEEGQVEEIVDVEVINSEDDSAVRTGTNLIDIVDYDKANDRERSRMDELMSQIDFDNDDSVIGYGAEAFARLQAIAEEINQKAREDGIYRESVQTLKAAAEEGDVSGLIESLRNYASQAGQQGVEVAKKNPLSLGLGTIGLMFGGLIGAAGGAAVGKGADAYLSGKKKIKKALPAAAEGELPEDVEEALRNGLSRLESSKRMLEDVGTKIPEVVADLRRLGRERLEVYKELTLVCSAGLEKEKRLRAGELKDALDKKAANPTSFIAQEEADRLMQSVDRFRVHINDLLIARGRLYSNSQLLKQQQTMFENIARKIRVHITQGLPQQADTLSGITFALRANDYAKALTQMDQMSTESDRLAGEVQDIVTEMVLKSEKQGVHNEQAFLANMKRHAASQLKLADYRIKEAKTGEKDRTREQIAAAVQELSDAVALRGDAEALALTSRVTGDKSGVKALEDRSAAAKRGGKSTKPAFNGGGVDETARPAVTGPAKEADVKRDQAKPAPKS